MVVTWMGVPRVVTFPSITAVTESLSVICASETPIEAPINPTAMALLPTVELTVGAADALTRTPITELEPDRFEVTLAPVRIPA